MELKQQLEQVATPMFTTSKLNVRTKDGITYANIEGSISNAKNPRIVINLEVDAGKQLIKSVKIYATDNSNAFFPWNMYTWNEPIYDKCQILPIYNKYRILPVETCLQLLPEVVRHASANQHGAEQPLYEASKHVETTLLTFINMVEHCASNGEQVHVLDVSKQDGVFRIVVQPPYEQFDRFFHTTLFEINVSTLTLQRVATRSIKGYSSAPHNLPLTAIPPDALRGLLT